MPRRLLVILGYFSLDGKLRYYLQGRALDGLSVGAVMGVTSLTNFGPTRDDSGTALGLGFALERQWLLGFDERFAATLGVGGKRLFFFDRISGASAGLPSIRLSIGWAF